MSKPRILSGITATGKITIGNYIGAIKSIVELQNSNKYDLFIFVADLHALTIDISAEELKNNRKNILALYVACGIDPQKTTIFYQSDVVEHTQLAWIFENKTTIGELSRMTQYKDKAKTNKQSNQTEKVKTGLLTYPTLMAADILLYSPKYVPVGEDQKQHLELARNIVQRFNNEYGQTFDFPEIYIPKLGAKIMSLTEPHKKMSKSDKNNKSYIALLDKPEDAVNKILKAVTDSENKIYLDKNKPGIYNLITIYAALKNLTLENAEAELKQLQNYGFLKQKIAEVVEKFLINIQQKYHEAIKNIDEIAKKGAKTAQVIANEKLTEVYKKIGL